MFLVKRLAQSMRTPVTEALRKNRKIHCNIRVKFTRYSGAKSAVERVCLPGYAKLPGGMYYHTPYGYLWRTLRTISGQMWSEPGIKVSISKL